MVHIKLHAAVTQNLLCYQNDFHALAQDSREAPLVFQTRLALKATTCAFGISKACTCCKDPLNMIHTDYLDHVIQGRFVQRWNDNLFGESYSARFTQFECLLPLWLSSLLWPLPSMSPSCLLQVETTRRLLSLRWWVSPSNYSPAHPFIEFFE